MESKLRQLVLRLEGVPGRAFPKARPLILFCLVVCPTAIRDPREPPPPRGLHIPLPLRGRGDQPAHHVHLAALLGRRKLNRFDDETRFVSPKNYKPRVRFREVALYVNARMHVCSFATVLHVLNYKCFFKAYICAHIFSSSGVRAHIALSPICFLQNNNPNPNDF